MVESDLQLLTRKVGNKYEDTIYSGWWYDEWDGRKTKLNSLTTIRTKRRKRKFRCDVDLS